MVAHCVVDHMGYVCLTLSGIVFLPRDKQWDSCVKALQEKTWRPKIARHKKKNLRTMLLVFMTFIASCGSIFGYAVDINMALRTEERVITEHPSLPQSLRGCGLRNKKGGPRVEKSGLIIFGLPPPTKFPTRRGVNFQGFVCSPGAPRKPQRDSSEISLTDQKCCSGGF